MDHPRISWSVGLTCLLVAASGQRIGAQPSATRNERPRVAVVMSGGSAKGFAQIGVLHVLEEAGVPVDLITGSSMGAIIAGLYAAGYSPADLERLALAEDWGSFFKRPKNRRNETFQDKDADQRYSITFPLNRARPGLPSGFVSRQGIAKHIERLTWPVSEVTDFSQLPTEYAALVTDLSTGKPILLRSGSIAEAMEASAAVPGAFAPLRLSDGRMAVDGAVVRNIPAIDARALGADILICVDVSEQIASVDSLHSLVDILNQAVSFRVQESNAVQLPLCNVVITPDISGITSYDFELASEWIARGRAAALAHLAELVAIADSVRRSRGQVARRPPMRSLDSLYIESARWTKVSKGADEMVRGTHELRDSAWTTLEQIERAVARIYATGRFDQVSFRVVPRGSASDLVFDLSEGDRDVLGIGVRYDTPHAVALLASAEVTDWPSPGSTASASVRLGEEQQFDFRDIVGAGPKAHFTQTYRATLTKTALPEPRLPGATGSLTLGVLEMGASVERALSSVAVISAEVAHQWSDDGAPGADSPWSMHPQSITTLSAAARFDTYDRVVAPTQGYSLVANTAVSVHDRKLGSTYSRHFVDAQGILPVQARLTIVGHAVVGYAAATDLPVHERFFLGGSVPSVVWPTQFIGFLGLPAQSRSGNAVIVGQAGIQMTLMDGIVATLRGNVGNVFERWPNAVTRDALISGVGATATMILAPGPLSLSFATRGRRLAPVVEVSFGALF